LVKPVFFIGEINVDIILGGLESLPEVDREVVCASFDVTIGSSTAICACNYASLGGAASFVGLAGEDEYGDFMVRGLREFRIGTELVRRTAKVKTGVTVNLIFGKTRTQVTYPGAISEFGIEHIDLETLNGCRHIHIGGPFMQTRLLPHVASLLRFARNRGVTTSLDPQWDSSGRWAQIEEWLPLLTWFFPNRDEALAITGVDDPAKACLRLAEATDCPVVKLGGEGAMYAANGSVVRRPGYPVDVVDTTGAGDAFDAGFLHGVLDRGMETGEAVSFANAVAARSCTFVGGVNARSSWEDISRFLEEKA
jgi:sugar/nucleoside kinase (ribokinase family)